MFELTRHRDNSILSSLFLITIISRLPFTSKLLFSQDSCQFALALKNYNVAIDQPHPPGYFLYVMLGRMVYLLIKDANSSFIAISIVSSAFAVIAVYLLAKDIFGEKTGLIAAILTISSPNLWFHGEVALSYTVEAFFSSLIALFCWRLYKGDVKYLWHLAIAMAVAGGIRQNTPVFLLPLCLFALHKVRLKSSLVAAFLFVVLSLAWFGAMLYMTGGPDAYWAALHAIGSFVAHNSLFYANGPPFSFFVRTLLGFVIYCIGGLGLAILVLGFYNLVRSQRLKLLISSETVFFSLWILPAFLFHLFIVIHPAVPGHSLIFAPPLLILTARTLLFLSDNIQTHCNYNVTVPLSCLLILTNICLFLFSGVAVSYTQIRMHDKNLASIITALKSEDSATTALFINNSQIFYGLDHIVYYLPDYSVCDTQFDRLGENDKRLCRIDGRKFLTHQAIVKRNIRSFSTLLFQSERPAFFSGVPRTAELFPDVYLVSGPVSELGRVYPFVQIHYQ